MAKAFSKRQIATLRKLTQDDARENLLLELGVCSVLRGGDLLKLKVADVMTLEGKAKETLRVWQQKTGRYTMELPISETARQAIEKFLVGRGQDEYIFTGQKSHYRTGAPISMRQYQRIVKSWVEALGVDDPKQYSTHSLRKVFPTELYKQHKNIVFCQKILGHANIANTVLYLQIDEQEVQDVIKEMKI